MDRQLAHRALILAGLLTLVFTCVSARLFELQVLRHEPAAKPSGEQRLAEIIVPAARGQVFDARGLRLTRNRLVYRLVVDRNQLSSEAVALRGLQATRGLERGELLDQFDPTSGEMGRQYLADLAGILATGLERDPAELAPLLLETRQVEVVLATDVPSEAAFGLMERLEDAEAVGIRWEPRWLREYPLAERAGHLIGYVNYDGEALSLNPCEGVERSLDEVLSGRPGSRRIRLGRLGESLGDAGCGELPEPGESVRLSIDLALQEIVESELAAGMREFDAERGAAVLLDPHSGAVMALASWPFFEPNQRRGERANHAVSMRYEPGSTIKMVAVAGALDRQLVGLDTPIDCGWQAYRDPSTGVRVPDHHYYSLLPVRRVISKSSNIGTYKIARQLGSERWFEYAHAFGFGAPSGISLTGEAGGRLVNSGNPTDFSRNSYGYNLSVTPLQVACAYATIANGGLRQPPRLVEAIVGADGHERPVPVAEPRRVVSERAAAQMTRALAETTEKGGTATQAAIPGYRVAGKTGTAQRYQEQLRDAEGAIIQRGGYISGEYVVSFVGFAPAEDPAFVCAVVVDNPQTTAVSRYGGTVAAPIFQRIGSRVLEELEIEQTEPVEIGLAAAP